ncbi:L,D-transpeptidase [Methylobacterium goesingense]|uniref:Lipoprotein-anchoring transpeptidase ErfK/SrfK n=2 Tax=Pseudomonadota TaxID=1224 RepID=A0ABV2L7A8_9HYPH|nr:hypothetical protein CFIICLFH_1885 [Methylobacterium goesingense]
MTSLARLLPLILLCGASPALAISADESPEGRWAPTLKACRDPEGSGVFEVRLKAQAGPALEGAGNLCRITRVSDTAIGYRLALRCYGSAEDQAADRDASIRQIVVDAIGPVTMRTDGRRVYRCAGSARVAAAPIPPPVVPGPATPPDAPRTESSASASPATDAPSPQAPMSQASVTQALVPDAPSPFAPPPEASTQRAALPVDPTRRQTERPVWRGQLVDYAGSQEAGTIVVSTRERALYLVQANGKAIRYRVAVGRAGATWTGVERVTAKQTWPGWTPTPEMRRRRPGLPHHVAGGPRNPLGARALYLGDSAYRIHGTTEPGSIGRAASSGCFRMLNKDVIELYERVPVGTRVEVM